MFGSRQPGQDSAAIVSDFLSHVDLLVANFCVSTQALAKKYRFEEFWNNLTPPTVASSFDVAYINRSQSRVFAFWEFESQKGLTMMGQTSERGFRLYGPERIRPRTRQLLAMGT